MTSAAFLFCSGRISHYVKMEGPLKILPKYITVLNPIELSRVIYMSQVALMHKCLQDEDLHFFLTCQTIAITIYSAAHLLPC